MALREQVNVIIAKSEEEFDKKFKKLSEDKTRIKQLDFRTEITPNGTLILIALFVTGQ